MGSEMCIRDRLRSMRRESRAAAKCWCAAWGRKALAREGAEGGGTAVGSRPSPRVREERTSVLLAQAERHKNEEGEMWNCSSWLMRWEGKRGNRNSCREWSEEKRCKN